MITLYFIMMIAGILGLIDKLKNRKFKKSLMRKSLVEQNRLVNLSYFVFVGSLIPWAQFSLVSNEIPLYKLVLVSLWVLILRRLPIVYLLRHWIPALKNRKEVIFLV